MMKPIDGTELKKHIESTICYGCEIGHVVTPCGRCFVSDLLRYIDEMQEVDAQPVKHGKWIKIDSESFHCSECDAGLSGICVSEKYISREKFCYNCGAKMDGDADETP